MKLLTLLIIPSMISGCYSIRVDTADNCLIEGESFASIDFWKNINCTDDESGTLETVQEKNVERIKEK